MTLSVESSYNNEKRLVPKEFHHRLSSVAVITIILAGCFGVGAIVALSSVYRSAIFTHPLTLPEEVESAIPVPLSAIDLGSVNGFVTSSDGLPISGVAVHVYKHMALPTSADENAGYSTSVTTEPDGSYSLSDLPSGVYKFTVNYPDGVVQTIDNYAVWPSSSSSYIFRE
ncbi:MAG TPA: carboxypeptidase-like regulatory domain-containing protein [Nitrososphaeraceae archaeon]|jgi:hypothetical protein|nr:carboxypeptidase-like regulatory domain-containing protein [Nitrososphaeraceae archaeon]